MWGSHHSPQPGWLGELVAQGREAVAVLDGVGDLVYVNQAGADLLGHPLDGLVGRSALELVHPDDLGRVGANLDGISDGARPRPGLIRLRHRSGSWVALELGATRVELPGPPDGPGPVVAVVLRDIALQDAHWQFLTALSRDEPFHDCLEALAKGLSSDVDGPLAITYDDRGTRRCAGPLPPELAGVTPDGGLDATPGTPWVAALRSGRPTWTAVEHLPAGLRERARDRGHAGCVVVPVPDPGSGRPALLVQWPSAPAMAEILSEALRRRPQQAVTVALDRRHSQRRLEHLAHHDALSGLVNRARFFALAGELAGRRRPLGVCYVDLDRFKPVNDALGHVVGDHVIVVCARRLLGLAGPEVVVGRLGGDEFALAVPDAGPDEVEALAAAIVAALAQPFRIGEHLVDVGASVGCAAAEPGIGIDAAVAAADAALFEAKRAGRATWRRAPEVAALPGPSHQPTLPGVSPT